MKTPISRYLTLLTRLDMILTGHCLQKTGIGIEMSRVGKEQSNNAFSAETGHKFSRSSTRHDLVKPVGREDERFDLTQISTCPFVLWREKTEPFYNWTELCLCRADCDPGQVLDVIITKLVTRSRTRSILSPADHPTLKQKLHPFIIIIVLWLYSWWHNFQVESHVPEPT